MKGKVVTLATARAEMPAEALAIWVSQRCRQLGA
jgi:hypothetical protein